MKVTTCDDTQCNLYYISVKMTFTWTREWIKHIDTRPSLTGVPRPIVCRVSVVRGTIVSLFVARTARSVHEVLLTAAVGIPVSGQLPRRRLPLGIVHWLPWHLVLRRTVGGHATMISPGRCLVTAPPRLLFITLMCVVRPMLIVVSLSTRRTTHAVSRPWHRCVETRLCVAVDDSVVAVDRTHQH